MFGAIVFGIAIGVLIILGHKGDHSLGMIGGMLLCAYPHLFADALGLETLPAIILTLVGTLIVFLNVWEGGK